MEFTTITAVDVATAQCITTSDEMPKAVKAKNNAGTTSADTKHSRT